MRQLFKSALMLAGTLLPICSGFAHAGLVTGQTITLCRSPESVTIGDFNRDGKPDLAVAVAFCSNTVNVFLGNGDGTFQAGPTYGVGVSPSSVVTADLNHDGKLDLIT